MLNIKPDLTRRDHIAMLAQLRGCGQAPALIRRVDPMWGLTRDGLRKKPIWTVYISRGEGECPYCHCDCNSDLEEDEIEVAAMSEDAAKRRAERIMARNPSKYKGFTIESVSAPTIVEAPISEEIEKMFETAEARKLREAKEAYWAAAPRRVSRWSPNGRDRRARVRRSGQRGDAEGGRRPNPTGGTMPIEEQTDLGCERDRRHITRMLIEWRAFKRFCNPLHLLATLTAKDRSSRDG